MPEIGVYVCHCGENIAGFVDSVSSKPPRGTLIHHYNTDEKGIVTAANRIVATTHES